ncbi:MAG: UbiD family decarboxylase, partial [Acidobacteria bacterium]|nr:UbiD family decarboxylase [Acidobacteriota bacterium]
MAYKDLRDFLKRLEKEDELVRIRERVSPDLEITEITDRVSKKVGPALFFENVEGSDIPVAINLLGSERRMKLALGIEDWKTWTDRLDFFLEPKVPAGIVDKLKALPALGELTQAFPKIVSSGPCQEIILRGDEVDIAKLPILKCWPEDGGPFITMPLVFTKDPKSGKRNCGMYRMQVYDRNTTGMHWQLHKDAARQHQDAESGKLERIPVSVAIGCEPVTVFSAVCPLPPDVDEMMFTGFARGESVKMVKCVTNDLEVPVNAEIVLEGWVDPAERRRGPVRRPHRLLHRPGAVPGLPRHRDHDAAGRDLPLDRRRQAAPGGRLARQGDRADLPARGAHDRAGDRRLRPPRRRGLPQLRDRLDPEGLPRPRAQGDARDLGARDALALEG